MAMVFHDIDVERLASLSPVQRAMQGQVKELQRLMKQQRDRIKELEQHIATLNEQLNRVTMVDASTQTGHQFRPLQPPAHLLAKPPNSEED